MCGYVLTIGHDTVTLFQCINTEINIACCMIQAILSLTDLLSLIPVTFIWLHFQLLPTYSPEMTL